MTNCLSFLCNCFEYDYDKKKHPEYKSTLIPLNNLDVVINNLKAKYRRPVIQPMLHPISRTMPPIITMYPIINNN